MVNCEFAMLRLRVGRSGKNSGLEWPFGAKLSLFKEPYREARKMRPEEIKQAVKTRYGKFAETGGSKEAC